MRAFMHKPAPHCWNIPKGNQASVPSNAPLPASSTVPSNAPLPASSTVTTTVTKPALKTEARVIVLGHSIKEIIALMCIICWCAVLLCIIIFHPLITLAIVTTMSVIFGSFYYNHLQDMKNSPQEWEIVRREEERRARDAEHLLQAYGKMLARQISQT